MEERKLTKDTGKRSRASGCKIGSLSLSKAISLRPTHSTDQPWFSAKAANCRTISFRSTSWRIRCRVKPWLKPTSHTGQTCCSGFVLLSATDFNRGGRHSGKIHSRAISFYNIFQVLQKVWGFQVFPDRHQDIRYPVEKTLVGITRWKMLTVVYS